MSVRLVAILLSTSIRFVGCVNVTMFLPITAVRKPPLTALEVALKGLLPGVRPLVYLEILRSGKDLAAAGEQTGKGFFPGVHPYMIDELILGLEGFAVARTTLPVARVRCAFGSTHVVHL